MTMKRKNDVRVESGYRIVAVMLIGLGALVFAANALFSVASVTSSAQVVEQVARTVGETAGSAGQEIGTAAGEIGQNIGNTAGDAGRTVGQVFGGMGAAIGHTVGSLWPLLLIVVGLALIFRPAAKAKHDEFDDDYSDRL